MMRTLELNSMQAMHRVVGGPKVATAEAIRKNGAGLRIWKPTEVVR